MYQPFNKSTRSRSPVFHKSITKNLSGKLWIPPSPVLRRLSRNYLMAGELCWPVCRKAWNSAVPRPSDKVFRKIFNPCHPADLRAAIERGMLDEKIRTVRGLS
jgi:hypothetical protein